MIGLASVKESIRRIGALTTVEASDIPDSRYKGKSPMRRSVGFGI